MINKEVFIHSKKSNAFFCRFFIGIESTDELFLEDEKVFVLVVLKQFFSILFNKIHIFLVKDRLRMSEKELNPVPAKGWAAMIRRDHDQAGRTLSRPSL